VFAVRVSPGGPTAAPDAPPASDNAPATPNTVNTFVPPLRFEFLRFEFRLPCDMVEDLPFTDAFPAQGGYAHATTCAFIRKARPESRVSVAPALALHYGVATPDWGDKLIQSEQVGGRAHEAQFGFVWSGGGAAHRNGGADAFSRDVFHRRCWKFEVL